MEKKSKTTNISVTTITGRIGKVEKLKYSTNGNAMLRISVAVNIYMGKDKNNETDWYNVLIFGARAEGLSRFIQKGMEVSVTGQMRQSSYAHKEHPEITMYSWSLIAKEINIFSTKKNNNNDNSDNDYIDSYTESYSNKTKPVNIEEDDDTNEVPF